MISFKMMYDVPMLHHRFSNERWEVGGALNHLPLLFCKSTCARSKFWGVVRVGGQGWG